LQQNKKKMLGALHCKYNVLLIALFSTSQADTLFRNVQEAAI